MILQKIMDGKDTIINVIKFNILKRNGLKVVMLGQTMGHINLLENQL